jgi:GR25 family glycosyltransferase involved in LPS biosynthesis
MVPSDFYINLDRSVKRRRALEAELAKAGLSGQYRRYAAKDGAILKGRRYGVSPGEAGCFLSHLGALEAGQRGGRHFHVLEDDTVLARGFADYLAMIMDRLIDRFDIVFTNMLLPPNRAFIGDCLKFYDDYRTSGAFNVFSGHYWACLASYVVNINAAEKLIRRLRKGVEDGIPSAVDLYLADLVASGTITAGCLFPFVTAIRLPYPNTTKGLDVAQTTIARSGYSVIEQLILNLPQAAFYIDADLPALRAGFAALPVTNPRLQGDYLNGMQLLDALLTR